jgi:hypothetical protein
MHVPYGGPQQFLFRRFVQQVLRAAAGVRQESIARLGQPLGGGGGGSGSGDDRDRHLIDGGPLGPRRSRRSLTTPRASRLDPGALSRQASGEQQADRLLQQAEQQQQQQQQHHQRAAAAAGVPLAEAV